MGGGGGGGGGGVLSALGQFNQWGGGGAVHVQLSLCLKTGRVPSTYMAILETTLLPVCFKLTVETITLGTIIFWYFY